MELFRENAQTLNSLVFKQRTESKARDQIDRKTKHQKNIRKSVEISQKCMVLVDWEIREIHIFVINI